MGLKYCSYHFNWFCKMFHYRNVNDFNPSKFLPRYLVSTQTALKTPTGINFRTKSSLWYAIVSRHFYCQFFLQYTSVPQSILEGHVIFTLLSSFVCFLNSANMIKYRFFYLLSFPCGNDRYFWDVLELFS